MYEHVSDCDSDTGSVNICGDCHSDTDCVKIYGDCDSDKDCANVSDDYDSDTDFVNPSMATTILIRTVRTYTAAVILIRSG